MSTPAQNEPRVIPLRPRTAPPVPGGAPGVPQAPRRTSQQTPARTPVRTPLSTPLRSAPQAVPRTSPQAVPPREPLWRDLVGEALRRERLAQERTLKDVAEAARISMPYLSELERGRKEASSEVLAAAARALGLGLGDLLSRAQEELVRTERRREVRGRTQVVSRYDGLCLAA